MPERDSVYVQIMVKIQVLRCNLLSYYIFHVLGKSRVVHNSPSQLYIYRERYIYKKSSIKVVKSSPQNLGDARTKVFFRVLVQLLYVDCIIIQFLVAGLSPFSHSPLLCSATLIHQQRKYREQKSVGLPPAPLPPTAWCNSNFWMRNNYCRFTDEILGNLIATCQQVSDGIFHGLGNCGCVFHRKCVKPHTWHHIHWVVRISKPWRHTITQPDYC